MIYTAFISAIVYPISGMWMWGYGWLFDMGFKDFAGSVVVHTVGGFAGLAGAIALGPRIGKFVNGKAMPMPGHNIPYAALGVFILLIGWYGFNPGSQLAFTGMANTDTIMLVAVNTTLACCTGALSSMIFSWIVFKKPDLTFSLNGGLAGLVGITANCHCVTNSSALIIGAIAGVLVCLACIALDKLQIDDPVGAFPVHGVCGMWGGIATGIFGMPELAAFSPDAKLNLMTQIIGTLTHRRLVARHVAGAVLWTQGNRPAARLGRRGADRPGYQRARHVRLSAATGGRYLRRRSCEVPSCSPAFAGHAKPVMEGTSAIDINIGMGSPTVTDSFTANQKTWNVFG